MIIAKCTKPTGVTDAIGMFPFLDKESNPLPTLHCRRGEGIKVTMYRPNSTDPDEYQYVADLTTDRMVHKKRGPSAKTPLPSINLELTAPRHMLPTFTSLKSLPN